MNKAILIVLILACSFLAGWFLKGLLISTKTVKYQDDLYRQIDVLINNQILDSIENSKFNKRNIEEPLNISEIDKMKFTSGGGHDLKDENYCYSIETGFYGSYSLIDEDYSDKIGRPVGGRILVHSRGAMADWKSTDTNQTIWRIHLVSDVISVWDTIKVGTPKNQIEKFAIANKGNCFYIGPSFYACDFNNFSATFHFRNDLVGELLVVRSCEL